MASVSFNQGYKEYDIGGDSNRIVRFMPTDFNLPSRINQAIKEIDRIVEKYGKSDDEDNAEKMAACNIEIREQINYVFDSDVCAAAFGNTNCMSLAGGHPLYENFLNAILPEVQKCINAEKRKSEKNIAKYTSQVVK